MRKLWIKSLALSLGLVVTGAHAQELGKPIAIATSKPASPQAAPTEPVATLGKPQAIARTPNRDSSVHPASFTPARDPLAPVARGRAPDNVAPRPMPPGPASELTSMPTQGYSQWRRADDVVASTVSRNGGQATPTAAPPVPGPSLNAAPPVIPAPTLVNPPPGFGPPAINSGPGIVPPPGNPFPPVTTTGPGINSKVIGQAGPPCSTGCGPNGAAPTCAGPTCGTACGPTACGAWGGCGGVDGPRLTLGFEALYWWVRGDNTPALVNAAPPGTPLASTAFSNVLSGGTAFANKAFTGGRIRGLYWFTNNRCWGIDGSAFFLGEEEDNFFAESDGVSQRQLGRPFIDRTPGAVPGPASQVVAGVSRNMTATETFDETSIGNVGVQHRTSLWGFDANLRRNLWGGKIVNLDLFFGYRQLGLEDDLTVSENLFVTRNTSTQSQGNPVGTAYTIRDQFSTSNRFYGGQVGLDTAWQLGYWTIGLRSSVALGCTQQTIDISGKTSQTLPGAAREMQTGGLLALDGTNIGRYTRRLFGVVPEVGLTVGYDVCDWFRMTCGYNFLYWSNVARAGEQVDQNLNLNYAPFGGNQQGSRIPAFLGTTQDLFVHGLTFGLEFRY